MKGAAKRGARSWGRRFLLLMLFGCLLAAGFVGWTNVAADLAASGRLYDRAEDVPAGQAQAGLVFGCPERDQSGENPYFRARMEAAAALWKAGKVNCLIVSGDSRDKYYNEPSKMRAALVRLGVPESKIVCDYAGLRTLDSVVRAKEVFGVSRVVFVSQKFQNQRAAYIAAAHGLDFTGLNAADLSGRSGLRVHAREVLARVKMWLDVNLWRTGPATMRKDELSTRRDQHDLHL